MKFLKMTKVNKLLSLRVKIDLLDSKLISVLSKRLEVVGQIAELKKANNIKPLDKNRWKEVLKSRKSIGRSLGVSPNFIQNLFDEIHSEALKIESKIIK